MSENATRSNRTVRLCRFSRIEEFFLSVCLAQSADLRISSLLRRGRMRAFSVWNRSSLESRVSIRDSNFEPISRIVGVRRSDDPIVHIHLRFSFRAVDDYTRGLHLPEAPARSTLLSVQKQSRRQQLDIIGRTLCFYSLAPCARQSPALLLWRFHASERCRRQDAAKFSPPSPFDSFFDHHPRKLSSDYHVDACYICTESVRSAAAPPAEAFRASQLCRVRVCWKL